MELFNPYLGVITICVVVILSYNFNIISKYIYIPSVLLLIGLGIGIKQGLLAFNIDLGENILHILELVGIVGLIMIVLEAAIELELKRKKIPLILKSFFIAFFALIITSFLTAYIIYSFILKDLFIAMLNAVPLSIMSSAIIIPSVTGSLKHKKEFLVYESAFSDILGIMFFYFLLGNAETPTFGGIVFNVSTNILSTVILAVLVSYFMVWLLQRINLQIKLILLISVLVILYAIAKMAHLSSLIIILIFGLLFFSIPLSYQFSDFSPGILLYTIMISSIIMAFALVATGKEKEKHTVLNFDNWDELDKEVEELKSANELQAEKPGS